MTTEVTPPGTERPERGIGRWDQTETGPPDTVPSEALGGPSLLVNARGNTVPLAPLAGSPKTPLLADSATALLPRGRFRSD